VVVTAHRIVRGGPAEPKVLKNKAKRSHLSDEAKKKRRSPEIPPLPARDAQQRHGLCRVFKKNPPKKPCISAIGTVAVGTPQLATSSPAFPSNDCLPSLSSSGLARIHSHAQLVLFFSALPVFVYSLSCVATSTSTVERDLIPNRSGWPKY
jgi:hypothetical protein